MKVTAFAVKRIGYDVSVIAHTDEGQIELEMDFDELKELAALSQLALSEVLEEMHWDAQSENEALNRAEDEAIRQKETAAELDFSRQGYDDIPF